MLLSCSKNNGLNSPKYFVMKIPNGRELQQISFSHSSDIDFRVFMNLYKKCIAKPYSFFVIDATLASDNLLRFRKNFLKKILKLMIRLEMENYIIKLTKKKQSYRHCHQVKLININILQMKKYYLFIKEE